MESKTPLVSIVCDTYNHAPYVRAALDGFLMQKTDFPFEIVVHDDASTDGTADVVREYEAARPDLFRCVYRSENMYSRDPKILEHYVFPLVRGKYVAVCEGDDFWTSPDKLQKQVGYLETHPECTLCVCGADVVDVNGAPIGSVEPYETDTDIPMDDLIRGGGGFVATAGIVAPARLAKERAPFCDLSDVDDAVLQLWFGMNGTARYLSGRMCAYRWSVPGSWTQTYFSSGGAARILHHEKMIRALEAFDEEAGRRWHESVEYCVTHQQKYEILRLQNDVFALRRPPYREQYRKIPLRRRIRMLAARCGLTGGKAGG